MATASSHCVPHLHYRRSSGTFLSLSFGRWRCYRRCHHHWWPPGPPLPLFAVLFSLFLAARLNGMIKWMLHPIWEAAAVDEWLYNGGPYEPIVLPPRARKGSCWRWRGISAKF